MVKGALVAGYTIIEMMVVLVVIAIMTTASLYGLSQNNSVQPLVNAQKELANTMRSIQNQVVNGSDGVSIKSLILPPASNCSVTSCSYTVVSSYLTSSYQSSVVTLPRGIQFANLNSTNPTAICFANPNLSNFNQDQYCVTNVVSKFGCTCTSQPCTNVVGFICTGDASPVLTNVSSFTITLTRGVIQKNVRLEGSGMIINRIYAE